MNKAVLFTTIGIFGISIAVGGIYLSGGFGEKLDYELPTTLSSFKGEKDEEGRDNGVEGCVLALFPNIYSMKETPDIISVDSTTNKVDGDFFKETSAEQFSGCLVINWDKKETNDNDKKWRGTFRFLWSVKEGTKGFVVFAVAENKREGSENKLNWSGVIYELAKRNDNWMRIKKLDPNTDVKQDKNTLNTWFSQAKRDKENLSSKNFWGFLDSAEQLDKACEMSECGENLRSSSFRGYWTLEESYGKGSVDLGNWAEFASHQWWESLFEKSKWDMKAALTGKRVRVFKKVIFK